MQQVVLARHVMPTLDARERIKSFQEVALGYDEKTARAEAARCLHCRKPLCVEGCPVEVPIPQFIELTAKGDFAGAISVIREKNSLPAICGRVCPQETQCESRCVLGKKGEPVAIGRLERFVADWEMNHVAAEPAARPNQNGKRVAVVGSGPAGLTVAGDLAKIGYHVTIFEALHTAGGVLVYGIPEFRLPKYIVQREIEKLVSLGVEIKTNEVVGQTETIDELLESGYDAVFIGTGAGLPRLMYIPGENLNGIYTANEFLTRTNLMKAYLYPQYATPIRIGQRVAVIGAGNVAMDAARTALRLGAKESCIVYRRSQEEMPARREEIEHAKEEGVTFRLLTSPVEFYGDEQGNLVGMRCIRYELGEADASGRRSPVPVDGSEFDLPIDTVILALGQGPNPVAIRSIPDLELTPKGYIVVDEATGATSRPGVFAGGDIVTGAATVIKAMGAGRKAARAIDRYLKNGSKRV